MTIDTTPINAQVAGKDIRVLFLHGSGTSGESRKADALRDIYDTEAPTLPFPEGSLASFVAWGCDRPSREEARRTAQSLVDSFRPHVICGSSIGGALAATLVSDAALVLVAPAFGTITRYRTPNVLPARTIILHSRNDILVPQGKSRRLLAAHPGRTAAEKADIERIGTGLVALGYDQSCPRLISIGRDHRCNHPDDGDTWNENPDPYAALVASVRLLASLATSEPELIPAEHP